MTAGTTTTGMRRRAQFAIALLIGLATVLSTAPAVAAVTLTDVRLEAGLQTGFTFSSTGTITSRKDVTLSAKTMSQSDRRRVVPSRTGTWLRLTTGPLAGYEVRESPVSYIPGQAGEGLYGTPAQITFARGRYIGYTFAADWSLASTRFGRVTTMTPQVATASRRAMIDGRPYVQMSSGPWSGTWMPVTETRSLTAQKLTCEVPPKVFGGSAQVLSRATTTERELALTFDMGGRLTPARDILERLIIDRVCATIFPTGDALATTEGAAAMALLKAHAFLFDVGNHTKNHCNLRDGGGGADCPSSPPTTSRIQAELTTAGSSIQAQTGVDARPLWRPPYGAHDSRVRAAAAAIGYTKTIMWDIDTIDWRPVQDDGPTAASMAAKVVTNARTGSIVLMHLGGFNTFDALPSMVMRLRANGLQPTTVTDLLQP